MSKESLSVHKGRGALSNQASRFSPVQSEWDDAPLGPSPVTECRRVTASSIIASNQSPDIPFDRSINPYQGCEHGCVYCYARPSHAYLDLSPGLDFETRLTWKHNAAQLLQKALSKPGYQCREITIGANTDPYQPIEKQYRLTRQLLEVLLQAKHPVSIITKGSLITRDIDLLTQLAADGLCSVAISISTLDNDLKRLLEPRAAANAARFKTIAELSDAGIPVTLLLAPVIPALTDSDMESILEQAAAAGAKNAAYILLRLPLEVRDLFYQWLHQHYPLKAEHIISLIRQSRGGKDYDSNFKNRMRGEGHFADILRQRFNLACKRLNLQQGEQHINNTALFRAPMTPGTTSNQIDLFTA